MIFTYMLAFDVQFDKDNLDNLVEIFRREGAEICYVELVATQEVRILRNATENGLYHKPSKKDIIRHQTIGWLTAKMQSTALSAMTANYLPKIT